MFLDPEGTDQKDTIPFSWHDQESSIVESVVEVSTNQLMHPTKSGVFLWWSDQVPSWVHPDDMEVASGLVPGNRIFRRSECENSSDRELGYSMFRYGPDWFRGKPTLWLEVQHPGFEIGDLIEIKSQVGRHRPQIGEVAAAIWNRKSLTIQYTVSVKGVRISRPFAGSEIRPAIRLGQFLSSRERRLIGRREFNVDG